MAKVFEELGGLDQADRILLLNPSTDQKGLLLKDGQFTYKRLHNVLKSIDTDVRLVILVKSILKKNKNSSYL